MTRRPSKLHTLLLALILAAPAGAVEKGVPEIPSLGAPIAAPVVPGAALSVPGSPELAAPVIPSAESPRGDLPAAAPALPGNAVPQARPDGALPLAAPQAAQAAQPAQASKPVAQIAKRLAPELANAAKASSSGEASAASGQNIQTILQGGKAASSSGSDAVQASAPSAPSASGLSAPSGASSGANGGSNVPPPSSPKAAQKTGTNSRLVYFLQRRALRNVAAVFGLVYPMPAMGPKLADRVLLQAAGKRVVFSDIDDTLAKYNTVLTPEMAAAIAGVQKRGKQFVAITDRPDFARQGSSQMGAFDTLATIPAGERAGIMVATNGGGKIYRYDAQGEPKLVYEEPGLPEDVRAKIKEAAAVVVPELEKLGTALQTVDAKTGKPMNAENHSPYGYSMILKAGTPEAVVKNVAHEMQKEMEARGLKFEVEGRMAKDPSLPPYITFSKLDKSLTVEHVAQTMGVEAKDALAVGDSMYKPFDRPDTGGAGMAEARKLGERVSGGKLPLTGNRTDANMELGLPGMMAISVGGSADPRMAHGYVMPGKGPDATLRVLRGVASRPPLDRKDRRNFIWMVVAVVASWVWLFGTLQYIGRMWPFN